MRDLKATLSRFWSIIRNILQYLFFLFIGLSVLLSIALLMLHLDVVRNFKSDLSTAQSVARAWAGLNCTRPPAGQLGLADVLRDLGWDASINEVGAWGIRLTTGPDGICTGAMILYSGRLVDKEKDDESTQRLFERKCAIRQSSRTIGFLVRPIVTTGSHGEYQLNWKPGRIHSCYRRDV